MQVWVGFQAISIYTDLKNAYYAITGGEPNPPYTAAEQYMSQFFNQLFFSSQNLCDGKDITVSHAK
jgi:hypothetical protein